MTGVRDADFSAKNLTGFSQKNRIRTRNCKQENLQ